MYKVNFYFDKNGNSEVLEWLKKLSLSNGKDAKINKNKVLTYIEALRKYGTKVGEKICKHIREDIWELRPLDNRIMLFYHKNDEYVLLSQFIKKTNKTPKLEIEKAIRLRNDYIERSKNEK